MKYKKELLDDISEGLKNTDRDILYFLDIEDLDVVKTTEDLAPCIIEKRNVIYIEPMLKDILELIEDFALEQDTEEIQEHLLLVIKNKDRVTAIENFKKALLDYPKSKKKWLSLEKRWLRERASEMLDDYTKSLDR